LILFFILIDFLLLSCHPNPGLVPIPTKKPRLIRIYYFILSFFILKICAI